MTERFPSGKGWLRWLAALALLFALVPPQAGQCQTGRRACPMAGMARHCGCCCPTTHPGASLTAVPCAKVQARPAAPALLTRSELSASPVSLPIAGLLPTACAALVPPDTRWDIPPDAASPPAPALAGSASRAPPALLS
jgi:hypothetical protein